MWKFVTLSIALLWAAVSVAAQELQQPDSKWIERLAPGFDTVAGNPVEYQKVLDKFSAALVRLSVRDCAIAYYGFPLQPGFDGSAPAGEEDMQRAIMADDYATAYALGTQILARAPVNLTALYWTLFAATETDQPWEVRNSLRGRYNSIAHIIALSGDGTSTESALRVVWTGDMYTYTMLELGLEIGDGFLWDSRWTELYITPSETFPHTSIFFEPFPRASNS
ncbi:MAG: DUF4919 domain-containing protein [Alistipes sp.]|jgi:hypothetical protein|nr:DUF4919 domain-containing protein [Alistipes sp.]